MSEAAPLVIGDTIAAPIFNEWTLTAFVERIDVVADHRNIRARLFPPQEGVILLTVGQDRVAGNIRWESAGRFFYLRFAPDIRSHVLVEVDPEKEDVLPGAPPLREPRDRG
jgi:hypothetical protein